MRKGARVSHLSQAEEVSIELRASKVDQYNSGTWRNHHRSEDSWLCPVAALTALQNAHPERFEGGSEILKPLFRRSKGEPILASQIKTLLGKAAELEGMPVDRMGTHSLRIGGASALLHAKVPIETIKRMGRWVSDSFQRYLWEANEDTRGLSTLMARDRSTLAATRQGVSARTR